MDWNGITSVIIRCGGGLLLYVVENVAVATDVIVFVPDVIVVGIRVFLTVFVNAAISGTVVAGHAAAVKHRLFVSHCRFQDGLYIGLFHNSGGASPVPPPKEGDTGRDNLF